MKKTKKLLLWDIDGTLMHCGADGTKALNNTFYELYGLVDAFSRAGIGSAMDAVILDRIMESFNLDKLELETVKKVYVKNLNNVLSQNKEKRILPGVKEILEYVHKSENVFNGLLTSNLRMGAEAKLKSVGIDSYFQVGGFGDHYGEKWDAAIKGINEAENHFDASFEKENIFIIGDSIYDIESAKKILVKSIGVATGFMEYDSLKKSNPDYLYKDLSDWERLIEKHDWK